MVRKGNFTLGLEMMLNRKETSPIHNPAVMRELHSKSGMSLRDMVEHIGKGSKQAKKEKGPSDAERAEARLEKLESDAK
jgi:hypothetical protein